MAVPWGENTRVIDSRTYDVPQPPPIPVQLDPPGWQWESAGVNGPAVQHPPFVIVETSDMQNYFDDRNYPASITQLHGQNDPAPRTRLACDPQCQVDQYGRR